MRFLFTRESDREVRRALIVQTCNPNLLDHVTQDVVDRYPEARIEVMLQRGMRPWIAVREGVEYFDNPETARREMVDRLKAERYDLVVTTLSGEPGYWKLKLLPFLIAPRRVRVYGRLARAFDLTVFNLGRYAAEVGRGILGVASPEGLTLRLIGRKLLAPAIAAYLLFFLWRRRAKGPRQP